MRRRWGLVRLYWRERRRILRAAAAAGPGRQVDAAYREMVAVVAEAGLS